MITNNVVHRCVACGFSRSYECKRIYINAMRARIPSSISFSLSRRSCEAVVVGDVEGRWEEEEVKDTSWRDSDVAF